MNPYTRTSHPCNRKYDDVIIHSSVELNYLWLPLVGFLVGILASITGSGGSFFFLPVLVLVFHVPAQMAVATSLAASLPVCLIGFYGYYRKKHIEVSTGLIFSAGGIAGAFAGVGLTTVLTPVQLKTSFGIYSIMIAIIMMAETWKKKKAQIAGSVMPSVTTAQRITRGSFFGFMAGVIAGTFGTSGAAPAQAGLFSLNLPLKTVVGTTMMVVLSNALFAISGHFLMGEIDLTLVWFLTAGSILGSFTGTTILHHVRIDRSENSLRYAYASGMILFGILMMISNRR